MRQKLLPCYLTLIYFITIIYSCSSPQFDSIGPGWAKNSVNTVIFRRNSIVSHNGIQFISYYDSAGYVVLAKRIIDSKTWEVKKTLYRGNVNDAHCSISIMIDGAGYLHMAWDHHNNPLRYCKSTAPFSLELSEELSMVGTDEDDVTYPEFYKMPDGDLIFMYRNGKSGAGNLVINKYNLKTKKWERLHNVLIDGEGKRNAYWQAYVDTRGTIHISWVWRETWDVSTNHDLCYAKSADGGLTWQKSNGEIYDIPITARSADYAAIIPQQSELINQTSMYADSKGHPYITTYWKQKNDSIPQYHLVWNDGSSWNIKQISNRKTAFSLSGGGTKKIPISRPQLVVDERKEHPIVYIIYRDKERNNKVSVNMCNNLNSNRWFIYDLTNYSVGSWEPSYDTELWKNAGSLHLFLQKVSQGDAESLEDMVPQPVSVLEMGTDLQTVDTFITQN